MNSLHTRRALSMLLALMMVVGLFGSGPVASASQPIRFTDHTPAVEFNFTGDTYESSLDGLSDQQQEALDYLANRSGGAIGFEGEYALGDSDEMIPVIVEFNNAPAPVATTLSKAQGKVQSIAQAEFSAAADQISFYKELKTLNVPFNMAYSYTTAINGVALELPESAVMDLLEMDCVYAIYPSVEFFFDDTPDPEDVLPAGVYEGRKMMNVDELHDRGITGSGIRVGVIDSGIDYNHPDLQGVYAGGRNFVQISGLPERPANDPMETTYDEWKLSGKDEVNGNGYTFYTTHGTHVCGIIAANGNTADSARGIAPDAELFVYRAMGEYGGGNTFDILAAINATHEDECDVVNMSIGAATSDPYYTTCVAINNMVLAYDITFVISAGNSGRNGTATLTAPGTAAAPIVVGASTGSYPNGILTLDIDDGYDMFLWVTNDESGVEQNEDGTYRIVAEGMETNEQNQHKFVATMVDEDGYPSGTGLAEEFTAEVAEKVKGNIVVVNRGTAVNDVSANARAAGAAGVLVINDTRNFNTCNAVYTHHPMYIPTYTIPRDAGREFYKKVTAQQDGYANIIALADQVGGRLTDFSSRGPTGVYYDIKPDVVAHGQAVNSTAPFFLKSPEPEEGEDIYSDAYQRMSGTSMAAPHIAGVAALMKGYSKDNDLGWTTSDIMSRLVGTGGGHEDPFSVFEIGGGFADAKAAIDVDFNVFVPFSDVRLSSGEHVTMNRATLNYGYAGVVKDYTKTLAASLNNHSDTTKTYTLSHVFHTAAEVQPIGYDPDATLTHPTELTVPAGGSVDFDVTLFIPSVPEKPGSFEGYLLVSDGDTTIHVPFGAIASIGPLPANWLSNPFFSRPMISLRNSGQLATGSNNRSDYTDFYYTSAGHLAGAYLTVVLYNVNLETNYREGRMKTILASKSRTAGDYREANAIQSWTNPRSPEEGLYFLTDKVALEPGLNKVEIQTFPLLGGTDASTYTYLYVDGEAPELTVNEANDEGIIYYGANGTVNLSGNVYDLGMAEMGENDMYYGLLDYKFADQSLNGLFFKIGEEYHRANLTADGDFNITVEGLNGDNEIEVFVLDSFTPTVKASSTAYAEGFDPAKASYFDGTYVYYGTNIDSHNFTLKQSDEQIDTPVLSINGAPGIIETLAAYVRINVTGTDVDSLTAYLDVNGELRHATPIVGGTARMYIDSAPAAGTYNIVVKNAVSGIAAVTPILVQPYNTNIWTATAALDDAGVFVQYNAKLRINKGGSVTANGAAVPYAVEDAMNRIRIEKVLEPGEYSIAMTKVCLYELFPSYSFTYKASITVAGE